MSRRAYDNSTREAAARETRARILATAYGLLVEHGYAALSVADLARAAGVSPQTIYNSVGGKADVLKACYDVTLAGDDADVPMGARPELRRLMEARSAEEFVERYAAWSRLLSSRVAPLVAAFIRPGTGDPGIVDFVATIEQERRIGTTNAMTHLRDRFGLRRGLTLARAVDAVWTLNSPEVYDRLVTRSGWSGAAYEKWLATQLRAALLDRD